MRPRCPSKRWSILSARTQSDSRSESPNIAIAADAPARLPPRRRQGGTKITGRVVMPIRALSRVPRPRYPVAVRYRSSGSYFADLSSAAMGPFVAGFISSRWPGYVLPAAILSRRGQAYLHDCVRTCDAAASRGMATTTAVDNSSSATADMLRHPGFISDGPGRPPATLVSVASLTTTSPRGHSDPNVDSPSVTGRGRHFYNRDGGGLPLTATSP